MAYTPEQRKIAKKIVRIGRKTATGDKKARRVKIKSALETGLVESNLTNIRGGDADSSGWRQERASLYPDPNNLKASIKRYFAEANQHYDPGESAGELAGQVQRPAAQYLGRYAERGPEAKALLKALANGDLGGAPSKGGTRTTTKTDASASVDLTGLRKAALLRYLDDRDNPDALLGLASDLQSVKDAGASLKVDGGTTTTRDSKSKVKEKYKPVNGEGLPAHTDPKNLLELFWQGAGGVNVKHGARQPMGFVDGHTDHVHVAANPKAVVKLGKLAQDMGLTVRENKHFDPVDPVHTAGSFHYSNRAIDVSGDPALMRKYANRVAKIYGVR